MSYPSLSIVFTVSSADLRLRDFSFSVRYLKGTSMGEHLTGSLTLTSETTDSSSSCT